MNGVNRLARIALNSPDAGRLARFYVDALGFRLSAVAGGDVDAAAIDALEEGGRDRMDVVLGATRLTLHTVTGRRYPDDVAGWSPLFQHCAIVVADMTVALRSLEAASSTHRWTPISTEGPQRLPANTGHVAAFKFRDPDGHPLELLAFPAGDDRRAGPRTARVDHSAISVADVAHSVAFYEDLGFAVRGRTLNAGPAQQRLDDIEDPQVDIVALSPPEGTLHVELLGYRGDFPRAVEPAALDDVAATRLVLEVGPDALPALVHRHRDRLATAPRENRIVVRDPDGHLIELRVPHRPQPLNPAVR